MSNPNQPIVSNSKKLVTLKTNVAQPILLDLKK